MNIEEAARENSIKAGYNPNSATDAVGQAVYESGYKTGANDMRKHSILVYRSLCPSYKVQSRYECGNYSHRMEWKTKACDMNCQYMKNLMERL